MLVTSIPMTPAVVAWQDGITEAGTGRHRSKRQSYMPSNGTGYAGIGIGGTRCSAEYVVRVSTARRRGTPNGREKHALAQVKGRVPVYASIGKNVCPSRRPRGGGGVAIPRGVGVQPCQGFRAFGGERAPFRGE
jgi:hypothetical protein